MIQKKLLVGLLFCLGFGSALAVLKSDRVGRGAGSERVPGEIIVRFKNEGSLGLKAGRFQSVFSGLADVPAELQSLHQKSKMRRIRRLVRTSEEGRRGARSLHDRLATRAGRVPRRVRERAPQLKDSLDRTAVLTFDPSLPIEEVLREYRANPFVESVEPHFQATICLVPNDPSYSLTWGMPKIGAPQAWDLQAGSGVVVAVVDTGVDYTHPDLSANMWVNVGEVPANGIDDDGNGFVDDVRGWDFAYNDPDPLDGHFHGTHVAGTVAAVANNGLGVAGVAFRAKIMPVKGLDDSGSGGYADLAAAIIYAADNGADVINASWGGTGSDSTLSDAVAYAQSQGVVFVAAAGNSNADVSSFYPASYPGVIVVAATDNNDNKAWFSNWGARIDVAAPGVSIYSTMPGSSYGYLDGTSMASPHAAGEAALILSKDTTQSVLQVRQTLLISVDDIGAPGFDIYSGNGRINALAAVQATIPSPIDSVPPSVAISSPAGGSTVGGIVTLNGTAGDNAGVLKVEIFLDGVQHGVASGSNLWSYNLETSALSNGPHAITARATDISGLQSDSSISLTVYNPVGNAVYSPVYLAPACLLPGAVCDTGSNMVLGRAQILGGIEPNAPNTLQSGCSDGNTGVFRLDESNDRLKVYTVDGSTFAAGKIVRVEASVWAYSPYTGDYLDFYRAANAVNPVWQAVASLQAVKSGAQTLSTTFTLSSGAVQAVRANFRYSGSPGACTSGPYDDRDDLVFAVMSEDLAPPVISDVSSTSIGENSAEILWKTDEPADSQVEFGTTPSYGQLSPFQGALVNGHDVFLSGLLSGVTYHYRVISRDAAGNPAVSSDMTFTTLASDIIAPLVSVTSPADGSQTTGPTTLAGFASDNVSVGHVTLYVDNRLWKTLAGVGPAVANASGRERPKEEAAISLGSTLAWTFEFDTTQLDNGPHVLRFEAGDSSGNLGVSSITLTAENGSTIAGYDPVFKSPACGLPGAVCASGGRLEGRGLFEKYSEPNQPNTIQSACADGAGGVYHSDESLDWLKISSLDGSPLSPGKEARVEAKGWIYSEAYNALDLFVAADARSPSWVHLKTLAPTGIRTQVFSATVTLPLGGQYQGIRGRIRYGTGTGACVAGTYNDHDDLVYRILAVPSSPGTVRLSTHTSQTLIFSWGGATGEIEGYRMDASADPSFSTFLPGFKDRNVGPAAMQTIDGLSPLTTYYARVRAYNAGGVSANSSTAMGSTLGLADLVVDRVSCKAYVNPGETFNVKLGVKNIGAWPTVLPVGWTLLNNGSVGYSGGMPPLEPDEIRYTDEWAVTAPSVEGHYAVEGRVNLEVSPPIPESDTTNNSKVVGYVVDGTPPVVIITTPVASSRLGGVVPVMASATDAVSGVDRMMLSMDGVEIFSSTMASIHFSWNSATVNDGSHALSVAATDRRGLTAVETVPVVVNNADQAQRVSFSGDPGASVYARSSFTVQMGMKNTGLSSWSAASGYALLAQSPEGNNRWGASEVSLGGVTVVPGETFNFGGDLKAPAVPGVYLLHFRMSKAGSGAFGEDGIHQTVNVLQDSAPPTAPSGVSVVGHTTSAAQLIWNASGDNAGIDAYRVDVSTLSTFEVLKPGFDGADAGNALSLTIGDLAQNVTYFARVRSVDVNGLVSENSAPVSFSALPLPDAVPPSVEFTAPSEEAVVSGNLTLKADASDNVGVHHVKFLVDGVELGTDEQPPYEFEWQTIAAANGRHTLTALAADIAGNEASRVRTITLDIDRIAPTVMITVPPASSVVVGTVTVTASANDNVLVTRVLFYVDTNLAFTDLSGPYEFAWDTRLVSTGPHTVRAVAYDPSDSSGIDSVVFDVRRVEVLPLDDDSTPPPEDFGFRELIIYPNPVRRDTATVRIVAGDPDALRLVVNSLNGERLKEVGMGAVRSLVNGRWVVEAPLDVSGLSSGVYFLTVEVSKGGEKQRKVSKFVVVR